MGEPLFLLPKLEMLKNILYFPVIYAKKAKDQTKKSKERFMTDPKTLQESIHSFLEYAKTLKGDEKGEAQVFCDRLFQAFGHGGYTWRRHKLRF